MSITANKIPICSLVASWLGSLSTMQYRLLYGLIFMLWLSWLYLGVISPIFIQQSGGPTVNNSLDLLSEERRVVARQLADVNRDLLARRQIQSTKPGSSTAVREDIVTVIDRVSHQASVRVGALISMDGGDLKSRSFQQRYQLTVVGNYRGISDFVRMISEAPCMSVIMEATIKAPHSWGYPAEALEAKIIIKTTNSESELAENGEQNVDRKET